MNVKKEEEEEEVDEYNVDDIPQPSFLPQFSPIPTDTRRKEFDKNDDNSLILNNEIKMIVKQKGKRKSTPGPETLKLLRQRHSFPEGPSDFLKQFSLIEMDEDENLNEEEEEDEFGNNENKQ